MDGLSECLPFPVLERKAEMVELAYEHPVFPHHRLSLVLGVILKACFSKSVMILVSFNRIIK